MNKIHEKAIAGLEVKYWEIVANIPESVHVLGFKRLDGSITQITSDYNMEEFGLPHSEFVVKPSGYTNQDGPQIGICLGKGVNQDDLFFLFEGRDDIQCFPGYRKQEFEDEGFVQFEF